ncbi:CHAT domain-containing protein [Acrocarpospora corrugata]|uniref:CHAT domain-containing protein n=1 Tax=Acrocarpospora corrugata TaxID=35763 RepID=A0A5M3WDK3_9ACTN|nr:CHAT domain-containing protein [Acrocarpospora corrugata]
MDPVALDEAVELFACTTDPHDIAETCYLVGLLHWRRGEVFADERVRGEVYTALPLFFVLNESRSRLPLPDSALSTMPPSILLPEISDTSWRRLIMLLEQWFNNRGDPHSLRLAVGAGRNAVRDTSPGHPDRVGRQCFLGSALLTLFEHTGDMDALEEAIAVATHAVAQARTTEERAGSLTTLAVSLRLRFGRTGELRPLQQAIDAYRRALADTPEGYEKRRVLLGGLGLSLYVLYNRTGDPAPLDEAARMSSAAIDSTREGDPDLPGMLANFSNVLHAQFGRTGKQATLNQAIATARRAVDAAPPHTVLWQACLYSVSLMLQAQFEQTGDLGALAEAIEAGRVVVAATPEGNPDLAKYRSALAVQLKSRFDRTGDSAALDEAISIGRAVVEATPADHPNRGLFLTNLAVAFKAKAASTGDIATLRQAIDCNRLAVDAIHGWQRAGARTNLAATWLEYFDRTGETEALEAAVAAGRRAVEQVAEHDYYRALCQVNLARALTMLGHATDDDGLVDEAIGLLEAAAATGSTRPMIRVEAARGCGRLAMSLGQTDRAARGYALAVRLLPGLAARALVRADATHWMAEYARLAGDAAACAIEAGRPEEAVELLETGRGVLLAQSLEARTDLTDLRDRDADLADRFSYLCGRLDADERASLNEDTADRRRELAEELTALVARVRTLPGLDRFLLLPEAAQLVEQAQDGPIVMINMSDYRCDALILTTEGVRVQELPGLAAAEVYDRLDAMHEALGRTSFARRDRHAEQVMHATLAWLWDTVTGPVLERLGMTGCPDDGEDYGRIWWVPCGALAYFPLHAAGHHLDAPGAGRRTVIDRVASSYSATVRGLTHARARATRQRAGRPQMLAVAMPRTPGASDLPGARRELDELTRLFPDMDGLVGEGATRDAVLALLPEGSWVHFACHAAFDPDDPSGSQLLVHDHARRPLTVLEVSRLRLEECEFAYLSACSTAVTAPELADECVHAVTAFQLAGYPHVVGTLWEIDDAVAAEIATGVYEDLVANGSDPARSGRCLHRATRVIRDRYPHIPTLWAAHIHMGT